MGTGKGVGVLGGTACTVAKKVWGVGGCDPVAGLHPAFLCDDGEDDESSLVSPPGALFLVLYYR